MKTEKTKMLIRWCILGAIGAVLTIVQTWRQVLKKRSILALISEMSQGRHSNVGTVFFCGRLQRDDGTGCGTGIAHG